MTIDYKPSLKLPVESEYIARILLTATCKSIQAANVEPLKYTNSKEMR